MAFKRVLDPARVRLSKSFLLSDLMGNNSVYSKGLANVFEVRGNEEDDPRIINAKALCHEALEPLLAKYGPMSISYSYISPELSEKIVGYMDPKKPSHHRFDLGAAADICCHDWVGGKYPTIDDLYLPDSALGSPIALAHAIDQMEIPFSRLITYSESMYLCIAVSAEEVKQGRPRKSMYENKFEGRPKVKPKYTQLCNATARRKHFQSLQEGGLEHDWRGGGYPSSHGGGKRQYQHRRVSRYSMVSDWLYDGYSVREGTKNIPCLHLGAVQDSFAACGLVFDWLLEDWGVPRISIVSAYISHLNPNFDPANDWRNFEITFTVAAPEHFVFCSKSPAGVNLSEKDGFVEVHLDVNEVLNSEWTNQKEKI